MTWKLDCLELTLTGLVGFVADSQPLGPGGELMTRKSRFSSASVRRVDREKGGDMSDVTRILSAIEHGDPKAAGQLLPLVYEELRKLAARRLVEEKTGQTLQATALVHEAYLRLVGNGQPTDWDGCGHFFAAAAEAMRRILIDRARGKATTKRGGGLQRIDIDQVAAAEDGREAELLALDEALTELERNDPQAAQLVKLRYFAGLSHQQAAEALGIGRRAADRLWSLARAWLYQTLSAE